MHPSAESAALPPETHSLRGWEQIERPDDVQAVLQRLEGIKKQNAYACASLYDLAYPGYEGDREFYLKKAGRGRALYLGVGTGRIFAKLAARNPQAVGIEKSPEMLERLHAEYPHIATQQVLLADATEADLPAGQFNQVVAPYSFLQLIDPQQLPKLLENVRRWLAPGGRFYTDMFSPYLVPFRERGLERNVRRIGADMRVAIYVCYDHLLRHMIEYAHVESPAGEHVLEMHLNYYFPHEVLTALREAGFTSVEVYGGYHDEPFDPAENEVLVYEAQAPRLINGTHVH